MFVDRTRHSPALADFRATLAHFVLATTLSAEMCRPRFESIRLLPSSPSPELTGSHQANPNSGSQANAQLPQNLHLQNPGAKRPAMNTYEKNGRVDRISITNPATRPTPVESALTKGAS